MRLTLIAALGAVAALTAQAASAATANANLTVQATVADSCGVTDANLSFGTVSPSAGTALPSTGAISVTCTLGTGFSVGLGDGLNASSGARRMRKGATTEYLTYELYRDLIVQQRFGDSNPAQRVTGGVGLGLVAVPVSVFGMVPSGQASATGAYSDTVQITLYY